MAVIFDNFGRRYESHVISAADSLIKLKKTSGSNPWLVIERCIEIWRASKPAQWKSYCIYLKNIKETRKTTTVGSKQFRGVSRNDKKNDGMLAYTLDFPQDVMFMIRAIYDPDELPMNKEFFRIFAKRFPYFRILEKN